MSENYSREGAGLTATSLLHRVRLPRCLAVRDSSEAECRYDKSSFGAIPGTENHWSGISGRAHSRLLDKRCTPRKITKNLRSISFSSMEGENGLGADQYTGRKCRRFAHLWAKKDKHGSLPEESSAKALSKNSPQVKGVGNGEISIGWVNHYYLMRQLAVDPEYPAANYLFPTPADAGNLLMLSGVAVSKHSKKQALADRL